MHCHSVTNTKLTHGHIMHQLNHSCEYQFFTIPEALPESSRSLQLLGKHLIFPDIVVCHRATSEAHRLLKMVLTNLRHYIFLHVLVNRNSS